MISYYLGVEYSLSVAIGIFFAFLVTIILFSKAHNILPKDLGREYAVNGDKSAGKSRGGGIVFTLVFVGISLVFIRVDCEIFVYLLLICAEMLSGYFDDKSKYPWGEFKKGMIDLVIAIIVAMTYMRNNSNIIRCCILEKNIEIQPVVLFILIVILVWASINVTNCTDGIDGLLGTLSLITLLTMYVICNVIGDISDIRALLLIFIACILGYLWYNAIPSKLLMGDAGSRAIGIFLAIIVLKMRDPFLIIPVAAVIILDGGIGLVKVFLLRVFKIHILKNVQTPLHDYVRKTKGWSDAQTVYRFSIIQSLISFVTIFLLIN